MNSIIKELAVHESGFALKYLDGGFKEFPTFDGVCSEIDASFRVRNFVKFRVSGSFTNWFSHFSQMWGEFFGDDSLDADNCRDGSYIVQYPGVGVLADHYEYYIGDGPNTDLLKSRKVLDVDGFQVPVVFLIGFSSYVIGYADGDRGVLSACEDMISGWALLSMGCKSIVSTFGQVLKDLAEYTTTNGFEDDVRCRMAEITRTLKVRDSLIGIDNINPPIVECLPLLKAVIMSAGGELWVNPAFRDLLTTMDYYLTIEGDMVVGHVG